MGILESLSIETEFIEVRQRAAEGKAPFDYYLGIKPGVPRNLYVDRQGLKAVAFLSVSFAQVLSINWMQVFTKK